MIGPAFVSGALRYPKMIPFSQSPDSRIATSKMVSATLKCVNKISWLTVPLKYLKKRFKPKHLKKRFKPKHLKKRLKPKTCKEKIKA